MKYHNITKDDMNNGDGLRVVLWLSGCDHQCSGCQNPITWDPNNGLEFDKNAKEEVFKELKKDHISGITFTGGDPLYQNNIFDVIKLIQEIKQKFPNKTIWIYTGYTFQESIKKISYPIIYVNVLVDQKFDENLMDTSLQWRGSSNQHVINVQRTFVHKKIISHIPLEYQVLKNMTAEEYDNFKYIGDNKFYYTNTYTKKEFDKELKRINRT